MKMHDNLSKGVPAARSASSWLACSFIALVLLVAPSTLQAATATATWNPNPESDIAGYKLSFGTQSGNYTTVLDVGNVTSWTVQLPPNGPHFFFAVQAYNMLGLLSPYSAEVAFHLSSPAMSLDRPLANGSSGSNVTVSGWAIDLGAPTGTGVDAVHVYAFPTSGGAPIGVVATYGLSRPDVGAAFGNSRYTNSGFQVAMNSMPPGTYNFTAYMRSTVAGTFVYTATASNVTVNATTSNPQMNIDAPTPNASRARTFTISGWAVDTGAMSGPGVDAIHVYAVPAGGGAPILIGAVTSFTSRPDVGAYIGSSQFNNCGYSINVTTANLPLPGVYDFHVFAHSTVTGTFPIARVVRVNVL